MIKRWTAITTLLLLTILLLSGCSLAERFGLGNAEPQPVVEAAAPAAADPTPTPVVVSTPSIPNPVKPAAEPLVEPLTGSTLVYNGEIMADQIVPVVAEVAGQVMEVNVEVGDSVQAGDQLVRIDSTVLEAQVAQAMAAVELAQSQLELATAEPKESDLDAARAGVEAARSAYQRALQGATEEDKRMALSQLRQAEAAVDLAQAQYDRIAGSPFAGIMPESLQLQQGTLALAAGAALIHGLVPCWCEKTASRLVARLYARTHNRGADS